MKRTLALFLLFFSALAPIAAGEDGQPLSQERAVLRTSLGDIVVALYPDTAPRHAAKFLTMARMGLYEGSIFYLVYPNYVAQVYGIRYGGRSLSPEAVAVAQPLPAETSSRKYTRGTVAFAQDLQSALSDESSFSIFLADAPVMDGKGTILGEVIQGFEVVEAISQVKAARKDHQPVDPVYLERIEIAPEEAALSSMGVRGLIPRADKTSDHLPWEYLGMILLSLGLALGTFLSAIRGTTRLTSSLALLTFLSLFFLLYVAFVPQAPGSSWLGVLIFLGALFTVKLMTFFEK